MYGTIPELKVSELLQSCCIVVTSSLACKPSCSSSIITLDKCRNKVVLQVVLDNARIKGFGCEESFESIGLFHNLFTASQADCSCAFQKYKCAVRLMLSYHNEELRK